LIIASSDLDSGLRVASVYSLGKIGAALVKDKAEGRVPPGQIAPEIERIALCLGGRLTDADESVRYQSLVSLSLFKSDAKPAMPVIIKLIKSGNFDYIIAGASLVESIGPAASPAVPYLVNILDYEKARPWTVAALGAIGPAAAPAVPALLNIARRSGDRDKVLALEALAGISISSPEVQSELGKTIAAVDSQALRNLFFGIARAGEGVAGLLPVIKARVAGEDKDIRINAMDVYFAAGSAGVPYLAECFLSPEEDIRHQTCRHIHNMRLAAPAAILALAKSGYSGAEVDGCLAWAYADMGKPGEKILADWLVGDDIIRRRESEVVVAARKLVHKVGVEKFAAALAKPDTNVVGIVYSALYDLGPDALPAIPVLMDGFKAGKTEETVLSSTLNSVGEAGCRKWLPDMLDILRGNDAVLSGKAETVFPNVRSCYKHSIPALCDLLDDRKERVRLSAVRVLGNMYEDAMSALPSLEMARQKHGGAARGTFDEAIRKIRRNID